MSSVGKIYGYKDHAKVSRSLAAAKINGVSLDIVETQAMKGDCKKPEFLQQWPMGKIPAFEGTDGFKSIEGRAIARYSEFDPRILISHHEQGRSRCRSLHDES
jgi:elongation factor 1-gamma